MRETAEWELRARERGEPWGTWYDVNRHQNGMTHYLGSYATREAATAAAEYDRAVWQEVQRTIWN